MAFSIWIFCVFISNDYPELKESKYKFNEVILIIECDELKDFSTENILK